MAVVAGSEVDLVLDLPGGTMGHFVFVSGFDGTLGGSTSDIFLLRARDSGVGGIVYVSWRGTSVDSPPTGVSYTGPLIDQTATRLTPRRAWGA